MNLGRIINSFAQLNPFAVRVLVENNQAFAFRSVFGLKLAAGSKVGQRAISDYYARSDAKPTKITKAMIGSPLSFVQQRQGLLLNILLAPESAPKTSRVLRVTNPDVTSSTSEDLADVRPEQKKASFSPIEKRVRSATNIKSRFIEDVD